MAGTVYFELMLAALSLIIASSIIVSGIWLRAFRTTRSLLALNLIIAVCASACIGSILAIDPGMKRFLGSFQIIVGAVGTALFFFAFDFCFPQRKIPLAIKILMILVPVATLVLALTDQYHTLMRNGYFWIIQGRLYRYLPSTIGPWIWVDTIYGSVLYLISAGLLAFTLARTPAIYRRQVIMILTGLTAPLFLLVLVASKDMQFYQVGFNLIFIVIADIFLTWGVFTKQLASILPFSRDLVFRTTTEALLVVDRDLRILDANRTAIQILERSPESLATLSLSEVFSFDQQKLELQAQSNVDIALSQTITFRDRYLLLFFSRINDSRQAMVGWLVTLHDFTEQRRLENALAESELKYRNVADNADEGILIIQDGMVVYANQHMLTMAGYEHDEIINTPFLTYVAHHYRQRLAEQYADRIAGKPVANLYEAELLDKQGGMVEVEISANRIEYNRQPAVVAFVRDIQARKCTERELNRIQNRFRKFVEQSQDGFIIIDQEGRIVEWNEAMERITQMPRNLAQGQVITRIVPAMNLTMMAGAVNEAASGLQEAIIDTETGDRRIVQYLVSAIQTGEEDQYGIVVRDITALKRAEYELFDSEQRFQRLADATPVLIWIIDSSGCCQYVNKAAVEFAGKPAEVLLERGWASGINPDDMVMIDAIIHNPGDTDASTTHEIRAMRHDGEQRWLLCTAVRREDLAGIPIGFICSAVDITDQKMRETDLRKLSRAIEQSPAAVVITDLEGQIEYVNPRFHEMTGYELEDVRGQNPRILKSGEMPAQHYQAMWKAIRNGETWQGVFHNKKKNGDLYWDQTTISGITDLQGQLTHFLATKVDITAQRQAEEEARRMKQRMERIFNNPLVGIGLTNRQGRYNLVNQRYAEMLGYTTDELLQENVFRISSDDFVEATEDFFSSLMAGKIEHYKLQKQYRRKDGSVFWGEVEAFPIVNPDGTIDEGVGFISDITERKAFEEKLRASEELYRSIITASPDDITITDLNGVVRFISPAALKMFGYPTEDLIIGRSVSDFVVPEDRALAEKNLQNIMTGKAKKVEEYRGMRRDGTIFNIEVNSEVFAGKDGQPEGFVFVVRDITTRKNLETEQRLRVQELEALHETLNDLSSELDLPRVLRSIMRRLFILIDVNEGELALFDDKKNVLRIEVSENRDKDYTGVEQVLGEGTMGRACLQRRVIVVDDYATWEGRSPQYAPVHRAVISVPLINNQKLLGAISVSSDPAIKRFDVRDMRLVEMFSQQAAVAIYNAKLFSEVQRLAVTDSLTGVYNRRAFFDRARQEFNRSVRYQHRMCVIMLDVDHFKLINDRFGHAAGDEALRVVSGICQSVIRTADIIGRYGGEEFIILLPETEMEGAKATAQRLCDGIAERCIQHERGDIRMTVSIGVAELISEGADLETLIEKADQALYRAKASGRNRVSV